MGRSRRIRKLEPSKNSANGVWTINETFNYIQMGMWPGTIEYLVVGGGGGAGSGGAFSTCNVEASPGGGGAGGFIAGFMQLTLGNLVEVSVGTSGLGGLQGCGDENDYIDTNMNTAVVPTNGGNSSLGSVISFGGGRGGMNAHNGPVKDGGFSSGGTGGSGGGGAASSGPRTSNWQFNSGGLGTTDQGNNGGSPNATFPNAGGGGAGGPGSIANCSSVAQGGPGLNSSITGQPVTYARGGNSNDGGENGATNTGNGGSSIWHVNAGCSGRRGNGGSGVVVVAYSNSLPDLQIISTSGLTYSMSNESRPGHKVYIFTSGSGTFSIR
jgi:MSHA biogenesis protein MshQ